MANVTPLKQVNGKPMQMQSGDVIASGFLPASGGGGLTLQQRYPQFGVQTSLFWFNPTGSIYSFYSNVPAPSGPTTLVPGVAVCKDRCSWTTLPFPSQPVVGNGVLAGLAADTSENVGLLTVTNWLGNNDIWFAFYNGTSWLAWENVTHNATSSYLISSPTITVDAAGNFHVFYWICRTESPSYRQLTYAKRTAGVSGTWSAPVSIGSIPLRDGYVYKNWSFIDGNGYPRVLYMDNAAASSSKVAVAYWNGASWVVSDHTSTTLPTVATANANGDIFWGAGSSSVMKFSAANAWSTAFTASFTPTVMCCDTTGILYHYANGYNVMTWNGSSLANTPKPITFSGSATFYWPWMKVMTTPLLLATISDTDASAYALK